MNPGNFYTVITNIQKLRDANPALAEQLRQYVFPIVGCCQTVHQDMGPYLNEYMYQEALSICFEEAGFIGKNCIKEYYFTTHFHNRRISHPHKVDFLVNEKVLIECKAIGHLGSEQRQQLWNYMRLSGIRVGILYNFAPIKDECEKYYYDPEQQAIFMF